MNYETCLSVHPEDSSIHCELIAGNHPLCTGFSMSADYYVDWPNPDYETPKRTTRSHARTRITELASRVPRATSVLNQVQEAAEGSARVSRGWTPEERQRVLDAILAVAERQLHFTVDDVWRHLGDSVPVTMGIAALLRQAAKAGYIRKTSDTAMSIRERQDHDFGRHLRIWEAVRVNREEIP